MVDREAVSPVFLAQVEGGVRVAVERVEIASGFGIEGGADAGRDLVSAAVNSYVVVQVCHEAFQFVIQPFFTGDIFQEHHEFVAAYSAAYVILAEMKSQLRGDLPQYAVADGVPVAVVDLLEMVDVDHQQRMGGRVRLFQYLADVRLCGGFVEYPPTSALFSKYDNTNH